MNRKFIIGSICGIFFIVITIFTYFLIGPLQGSRDLLYPYNISLLETGLERYRTDNGKLPPPSENYILVDILSGDNPGKIKYIQFKETDLNPNREAIDHWKTPLRIIFHSDQSFSIRSAGPDRIFGTEDDAQFD